MEEIGSRAVGGHTPVPAREVEGPGEPGISRRSPPGRGDGAPALALLLALVLVLVLPVPPAAAQESGIAEDTAAFHGGRGELQVPVPAVPEPGVEVDGVLAEGAWDRAAILAGFTQYDPGQGIPASQRTEVRVLVTGDALLVGIRAFDDVPGGVRATLTERDGFTRSDDWVRLLLDTFDDRRQAYVFTVNPYGVQHDGLWLEGAEQGWGPPIDSNPDFIWESDARITDQGWEAELRIPFKSLRFPDAPDQAWGLNVLRRVQRTGYESSWAPLSDDVAGRLTQSGRLTGLRDLDPGLFLELNPVVTGKRLGEVDEDSDRFVRSDPEAELGLNVTYGLTSNLVLDATVNPDFSQVEADAGQIAVNERFALFFPEQRPFFLEGTEIFNLPERLVFTRTVANPAAGAKITGKVGGTNLGYLGAVDRVEGEDDVLVNLVRLRRDLGAASTAGAFYTDRTADARSYNRVGGADARLVLGDRYTLTLLGAGSWTGEEAEEDRRGALGSAELERSGRNLSLTVAAQDVTPGFRAGSGFLRRVGFTRLRGELEHDRYGEPGAFLESWGPGLQVEGTWDHDRFWDGGGVQEGRVEVSTDFNFRSRITVFLNYSREMLDFPGTEYAGLATVTEANDTVPFRLRGDPFGGLDGFRISTWVSRWERIRGNVRLEWSETALFDRSADVPVERAEAWSGNVSLDLFPLPALRGELEVRHETLIRQGGDRYSSATIPRLRLQYQFSRSLFVRGIAEYSAQEREALRDPGTGRVLIWCDPEDDEGGCDLREGSEENELYVEGLLAYEPSPGTVLFLGYSRDLDDRGAFRFQRLEPRSEGLFVKLSYRFRF